MYSSKPAELLFQPWSVPVNIMTYTFLFHFQNAETSSGEPFNSSLILTKLVQISRSFSLACERVFARAPGAEVAPLCRWKMSFLESWVINREVMMRRSLRSFYIDQPQDQRSKVEHTDIRVETCSIGFKCVCKMLAPCQWS